MLGDLGIYKLVVIVVVAAVLFRPKDLHKFLYTGARYWRKARNRIQSWQHKVELMADLGEPEDFLEVKKSLPSFNSGQVENPLKRPLSPGAPKFSPLKEQRSEGPPFIKLTSSRSRVKSSKYKVRHTMFRSKKPLSWQGRQLSADHQRRGSSSKDLY